MPYIYKIINTVNDKVYVGQTVRPIRTRFYQHLRDAYKMDPQKKIKLHRAIRKYGKEKFSVELIEECPKELLDEREQYWIREYDSYKNGYNATLGGGGHLSDFSEEVMECWENGMSVDEIVKATGHAQETVISTLDMNGITHEEQNKRGRRKQAEKVKVPVYQYDLEGNFVAEYASK